MIGSSVPRQSPAAGTPDQPRELDFATSGRIRRRQTSREWISEALVYLELARSRRSLLNQSEPAVTLVLQPGWSTRCLNSRAWLCLARNPQFSYRFPSPLNNHIGQRRNPGGGKSVTCQPRRCIGMPWISTGTRISRRKRLITTAAPWPTVRLPCFRALVLPFPRDAGRLRAALPFEQRDTSSSNRSSGSSSRYRQERGRDVYNCAGTRAGNV